ncbi:MAG: RNA 2',3'-cyclic phosphodiesterase [Acidobacteriaceae bacterium]|nr:RNA 2',3'-cyclic phosphodiesterase [Acidobacteriaceae bacterium]
MRLFTAIELPPHILIRLERLLVALRPEALIRWSPLDNLHITIKFIGQWPGARLTELTSCLRTVVIDAPFEIEIKGLGWFPNERAPRVLWAGVQAGDDLTELVQRTEACLEPLGIKKEDRPFSPHLTLARIKSPVPLARLRKKVADLQPAAIGTFSVPSFTLYLSEPGTNGSVYQKLQEFKLEAAIAAP